MDAIIFASYVPDKSRMFIIEEFFNVFLNKFSDVDFYIGINGDPCNEYIDYLDNLKKIISLTYKLTPKKLEISSDVSAYQTALKLLYDSSKEYTYIWFGHTKGMTHNTGEWRQKFINEFFNERESITTILNNSTAGTYSLYLAKYKSPSTNFRDILSYYYKFNKPTFYTYLYLFTFYVIKGKYIHNFLNNCDKKFYNNNLTESGADIYTFERDFPHIAWQQGGYPLYKYWDSKMISGGGHPENVYLTDVKEYYD